jgi:cobalt-zinc-cadmium resistance protein CzcA
LNIRIDRAKAARYGLNTGDVNTAIQAAIGGTGATTILEGDRQFGLSVRYLPSDRSSLQSVENTRIGYTTSNGGTSFIPLKDIASISLDTGATYIYHESNERYIPIKFSARGRDLGGTVSEIQKRLSKELELPQGYRLVYAGEFEELQVAKQRLAVIIPIAVALIIALLYALFNNVSYSFLSLAGIPFSVLGGIFALYITDQPLSVSAVIGFVSLLGVSVMDGILIQSYYRDLIVLGHSISSAVREAHVHRMRPLLMTALSACIGLLPAAMSHGIGSQVQRPLATVVVGGMLVGPVFLLLVVPALRLTILKSVKIAHKRKGFGGISLD